MNDYSIALFLHIIRFYPEPFWVDAAPGIVLFTFVEALLPVGLGYRFKRRVPVKST